MTQTMLTTDEITDEDIRGLRTGAGAAGDLEQVALCDRALGGDTAAREACAEAIADGAQSPCANCGCARAEHRFNGTTDACNGCGNDCPAPGHGA